MFTTFDRDALIYGLKEWAANQAYFQRIGGNLNMEPLSIDEWDKKLNTLATNPMSDDSVATAENISNSPYIDLGGEGSLATSGKIGTVTSNYAVASVPHYGDEIPPWIPVA